MSISIILILSILSISYTNCAIFIQYDESGQCQTPILSKELIVGECITLKGIQSTSLIDKKSTSLKDKIQQEVQSIYYVGKNIIGVYQFYAYIFSNCSENQGMIKSEMYPWTCINMPGKYSSSYYFEIKDSSPQPPNRTVGSLNQYFTADCAGNPNVYQLELNQCINVNTFIVSSIFYLGCTYQDGYLAHYIPYTESDCVGIGSRTSVAWSGCFYPSYNSVPTSLSFSFNCPHFTGTNVVKSL